MRWPLNINTIQSNFKTYPAVEKKHLELVAHEMSEQQFWGKLFQSHYFHRERSANPNPSEPFSDCIMTDDIGMHKLLDGEVSNKTLDFAYLDDGLDFTDERAKISFLYLYPLLSFFVYPWLIHRVH
ncbi:hypothetical protein AB6A40_010473 [Gnathostoma spinigerum]|uniref:BSD domain-containing protein n=1 Tax=Gnathostoma spinigerum TaxID=75299 RepID=A0ABD6F1M2_9BILA